MVTMLNNEKVGGRTERNVAMHAKSDNALKLFMERVEDDEEEDEEEEEEEEEEDEEGG